MESTVQCLGKQVYPVKVFPPPDELDLNWNLLSCYFQK